MLRDRLAAFTLATGAALWLGLHASPYGAPLMVPLAAVHGALAVGAWRGRAWSRWLGIGLALFWVGCALHGGGPAWFVWSLVALHAPLPLLLARPDDAHARTSASLLLAGLALGPLVLFGGCAAAGFTPGWIALFAVALALVGVFGLAAGRTWGLLALVAAGALLILHRILPEGLLGPARYYGAEWSIGVGLLLVSVATPFVRPMVDFLRPR